MLFNSLPYLFFLSVVAMILYIIPGRYQWLWLLACSTFFYYALLPVFLILFFALILLNYYLGIAIESSEARRNSIFLFSVCINIIVLAFFKYFGFLESLFADIKGISAKSDSKNPKYLKKANTIMLIQTLNKKIEFRLASELSIAIPK